MMQQRNSSFSKGILGLAVAILLPLSFYLIAKGLKKDHLDMPARYRIERVDSILVDGKPVAKPVYHHVQDFIGINQLGDTVSLNKDLAGKVLVVNFFFSTCPSVCPKMTNVLKMLQHAFRKDPKKSQTLDKDIQLVSISIDPERDSIAALRAYTERFGVNHDRWWFLRADKQAVANYARNELGLIANTSDGGADDELHSQKVVIIDQERVIRGYYDGMDSVSIGRAANDISLITLEKKKRN